MKGPINIHSFGKRTFSENIQYYARKHAYELIFAGIACAIVVVSAILFVLSSPSTQEPTHQDSLILQKGVEQEEALSPQPSPEKETEIYVEVSGAVKEPDVYKVSSSTRLGNVIRKAGGLSKEADEAYVARNFNLAKTLTDQEKVHIPTQAEIDSGLFVEEQKQLQYLTDAESDEKNNQQSSTSKDTSNTSGRININMATTAELDTLPRIGKITAEKIINNRPYKSVQELQDKKVVNSGVFEEIEELITI